MNEETGLDFDRLQSTFLIRKGFDVPNDYQVLSSSPKKEPDFYGTPWDDFQDENEELEMPF
jgi:hypothetical protein